MPIWGLKNFDTEVKDNNKLIVINDIDIDIALSINI